MDEQEACRGREVKLHFEVQNVQNAVMVGGVACKKAMRRAGSSPKIRHGDLQRAWFSSSVV